MEYFLKAFTSLIIIMGPFYVVPVFLSMTVNNTPEEKKRIITKAVVAAFLLGLFFMILGQYLFTFFGFSLHSFRVAGGALLFLMSMNMLNASQSRVRITDKEHQEGIDKDDISIFPLAIPVITGPGTITTVIFLAKDASNYRDTAWLVAALVLSCAIIYWVLRISRRIFGILGVTGLNILTRIMGLILASLSIEYIFQGIKGFMQTINS